MSDGAQMTSRKLRERTAADPCDGLGRAVEEQAAGFLAEGEGEAAWAAPEGGRVRTVRRELAQDVGEEEVHGCRRTHVGVRFGRGRPCRHAPPGARILARSLQPGLEPGHRRLDARRPVRLVHLPEHRQVPCRVGQNPHARRLVHDDVPQPLGVPGEQVEGGDAA
ncbi:hypothetical protein GCM10010344_51880 [Streptomyces bluensis]|nr:hypothetical protein GCM10010344_51880 [Streptomyces bluensis]